MSQPKVNIIYFDFPYRKPKACWLFYKKKKQVDYKIGCDHYTSITYVT